MKEATPLKWKDVVARVQLSGLEEQDRVRQEQQALSKHYVQMMEEQITRHQQEKQAQERLKYRERETIEQQLRQEQEQAEIRKRQKKSQQVQYRNINEELIKQMRGHKLPAVAVQEHPFIRLVEEEEQRKQESKNKFILQNNINELQSKIKSQERRLIAKREKQLREEFIKHVDRFYEQKVSDRNAFKRKYLKLNNLQKSTIAHSNNAIQKVEDEYSSLNSNQIDYHRLQKEKKDNVDDSAAKMNQHNGPNSSPAFLGRNPLNYDRKKQLQYLHRGLLKKNGGFHLRTEPTLSQSQSLKQTVTAKELPALQKFYDNSLKKGNITQPEVPENSPPQTIHMSSSQKPYKIRAIDHSACRVQSNSSQKTLQYSSAKDGLHFKGRVNTEPSDPRPRRKFMRFDIILGSNKEFCL